MRSLLLLALLLVSMPAPGSAQTPPQATTDCVDVNSAPMAALRRIIHVDTMRAAEIIRLREQRRFESVDELTRVRGIAAARLAEIKQQGVACVHPAPAPPDTIRLSTWLPASDSHRAGRSTTPPPLPEHNPALYPDRVHSPCYGSGPGDPDSTAHRQNVSPIRRASNLGADKVLVFDYDLIRRVRRVVSG
jgi:hypothetical protein